METYPSPTSIKHAVIMASTAGGLPSALRDAIAYAITFARRGCHLHLLLDVTPQERATLMAKLEEAKVPVPTVVELAALPSLLKTLATSVSATDVIVTISSHGYRSANHDSLILKHQTILDDHLKTWLTPFVESKTARCLVLVDTCHSASMCELPKMGPHLPAPTAPVGAAAAAARMAPIRLCSISACGNQQLDMDDMSTEFGFGGGLTSAVLDYLGAEVKPFDVSALFAAVQVRLNKAGVHPVLSWA